MGFSISWIAINGKSKEQVLDQLGLVKTGISDEANESPISGAELPGGWYLLFMNDIAHAFTEESALRSLSASCTVLLCQVDEHVMASAALAYENGESVWNVLHEAERGGRHLAENGVMPSIYNDIRTKLLSDQDDMDAENEPVDCVWDIPVTLAYNICGYRHDNVYLKSGGTSSFTEIHAG
jgi:hypothetical protein